MPGDEIVNRLQIDKEKSAEVQKIIQEDLKNRDDLMTQFRSAVEPLENKFRKDLAAAQIETEKKLEGILTADQLRTYKQLMSRGFFRDREFGFDAPPEAKDRK